MNITKNIWIEDLLDKYPQAQQFLSQKGIICIKCGEPVWGSLEEQIKKKGFSENELNKLILDLNEFLKNNP